MAKVVWIINNYAGTPKRGMQFRQYFLAKELRKLGYAAYVISASWHHLLTDIPEPGFSEEEGVPFYWIKTSRYSGHGAGRIKNMLEFSYKIPSALKFLPAPDFLVVSSPHLFVLPPSFKVARKTGAEVLFEVRDIWPLSLTELLGTSRYHPLVLVFSRIEKAGYRKSSAVVSLIPGALEHMEPLGLSPDRFFYIPNGMPLERIKLYENPDEEQLDEADLSLLKEYRRFVSDSTLKIIFTGTVGLGTGVKTIVETFAKGLPENITLAVFGDGVLLEDLKKMVADKSNVRFFGRVKPSLIPYVLKEADVAYAGWPNRRLYEMGGSPNKLFDYMAASKPIIFSAPVKPEYDIITQAGCGFRVPAEDADSLKDTILEISGMPREELKKLGENGKRYLLENHTYEVIASKYASLFEKLEA